MRDAFFLEMRALFETDPRVAFLTSDLGYKLFDPLCAIDADRVMNMGIREAGMIGFAAGLARRGMVPFVYSIIPFLTLRCIEQIKIDVCYNKCKVILVGVGGGFSYGANGLTHYGIDDIAVMSSLPSLSIWSPADPYEVKPCVASALAFNGPAYVRLGRNGERLIHESPIHPNDVNTPVVMQEDAGDGVIIGSGAIMHEVLEAVAILNNEGVNPGIVEVIRVRPFPTDFFRDWLRRDAPIMTVEEHVPTGGIGYELAALIADRAVHNPFLAASVPLEFPDSCLSRPAALRWAGLDANSIACKFRKLLQSC